MGVEVWLSAVAYGATNVWVLMAGEEAPQYLDAVRAQMDVAQAILHGLGYQGTHFQILQARDARDLASLDAQLQAPAAQGVAQTAGFAVQADKRGNAGAGTGLLDRASAGAAGAYCFARTGIAIGGLGAGQGQMYAVSQLYQRVPFGGLARQPVGTAAQVH